ncbi:MAG TPA: hypothetical protein VJ807_12590 [Gaiellaceae bacterium]|nr:hypothetical protein [Gaiellaceae bacterium]
MTTPARTNRVTLHPWRRFFLLPDFVIEPRQAFQVSTPGRRDARA